MDVARAALTQRQQVVFGPMGRTVDDLGMSGRNESEGQAVQVDGAQLWSVWTWCADQLEGDRVCDDNQSSSMSCRAASERLMSASVSVRLISGPAGSVSKIIAQSVSCGGMSSGAAGWVRSMERASRR